MSVPFTNPLHKEKHDSAKTTFLALIPKLSYKSITECREIRNDLNLKGCPKLHITLNGIKFHIDMSDILTNELLNQIISYMYGYTFFYCKGIDVIGLDINRLFLVWSYSTTNIDFIKAIYNNFNYFWMLAVSNKFGSTIEIDFSQDLVEYWIGETLIATQEYIYYKDDMTPFFNLHVTISDINALKKRIPGLNHYIESEERSRNDIKIWLENNATIPSCFRLPVLSNNGKWSLTILKDFKNVDVSTPIIF